MISLLLVVRLDWNHGDDLLRMRERSLLTNISSVASVFLDFLEHQQLNPNNKQKPLSCLLFSPPLLCNLCTTCAGGNWRKRRLSHLFWLLFPSSRVAWAREIALCMGGGVGQAQTIPRMLLSPFPSATNGLLHGGINWS